MTRVRGLAAACLSAGICLLAGAHEAMAQVTTGDVVGRVTDASGVAMPGVRVTIENGATGATRSMPTNASGDYAFNLLPIGEYEITIETVGFGTYGTRLILAAGDRARVDARLLVGMLSTETISVTGDAPLLQTDTATLSALVTARATQDLPVMGRNFVRLVQFVPGATEGVPNSLASGTRPDDRRLTSAVSINGALDNQNNQLIDGMDNNERAIGTIGLKPSIDAIAEVKVQTNMYTAEVGRTAGGVVNVITKSGGNDFHGSAYWFYRDEMFDARNVFATTGPKPAFHQNEYGASLGGPLVRNKTFFFVDYEGFRQRDARTLLATVPTARMRRGDFSELSVPIYDPTTAPRRPFPGNVIPTDRIDPIAARYMALYPLPTAPGLASNFSTPLDRTQDSHTVDARLDHHFNESNTLWARYSYNDVDTFTPGVLPPTADGVDPNGNLGLFGGPNATKVHLGQINYVRVHNPSLVSELKVGYLYADIESLPLNYGKNFSQAFGLPNVNIDEFTSGLTPLNPTGYALLGDSTFLPLIQIDRAYQGSLSVQKIKGAHNLKAGLGLIARRFTVFQSASAVGQFNFTAALTDNGAGSGGNSLASMLLGFPSTAQRSHSLIYPHYQTDEPSAFLQDDWRATSWLTLNIGVRYDVFTPYNEADDQLANFDLTAARIIVAGRDGVSSSAGIATDYSNVAPRFGLSISLPAKFVLRGGFGLSFFPGNYMSQSFLKNPPFVGTYGPVTSTGASGGLPSVRLSNGLPLPAATDPNNPTGTIIGVDRDFMSTRVSQYNVVLEKEFAGNVLSVGYVGSQGRNVAFVIPDINLAPAGPGAVQPRRPYFSRLPGVNTIGLFASDFESAYDALQVVFQRRHRSGLTVGANYSLAHATWTQLHPNDISVTERFDSDFDVRHRGVLTLNYELPFGRSAGGVTHQLLADWQINLVAFWQTGLPFTVTNLTARSNTGAGDRPNQVGDPGLSDPSIARWFDTAAFVAQPINTIGNTGRNTLHGPPQRRVDLSLFKNFVLKGDARLQARVECYNVTNTPSFGNPNAQLGSPAFGTISTTANSIARQMQFALKFLF